MPDDSSCRTISYSGPPGTPLGPAPPGGGLSAGFPFGAGSDVILSVFALFKNSEIEKKFFFQ